MSPRVLTIVVAAAALLAAGSRLLAQDGGPQVSEGIVKAPVAEVWKVFSTAEGFKKLGVKQCEMDFRVGGLIKTHYDPNGTIGDEGTIQNEILAFEPERMVSIRIHTPPKGFPFDEATRKCTWTVISLTDLGEGRTHVRITALGYPDTEGGRKMREFFKAGNGYTLELLKKQFDAAAPGPSGPPHPKSSLAPIVHERTIELPRSEVWDLVSTSAGWKKFLGVDANIELKPGGKWEILFGKDAPAGKKGSEGCVVLSYVPQRMLSYTWNAPPKMEFAREKRTWVVVNLDEVGAAKTKVTLEHHGFAEQAAETPDHKADWEEARVYFDKAWPKVLDALKGQEAKPR